MRILIIDDLRILDTPDGADVTYARTLADAFAALRDGRWDQVWFDHDLGKVDGKTEEAYPVAVEMEWAAAGAADPVDVGEVFVHTDNVNGGPRLMQALRAYRPRRVRAGQVTVGRIDD